MRKIMFVCVLCAAAFSVSCTLSDEELVFTKNISHATYSVASGLSENDTSITGITSTATNSEDEYVITFSAYGTDNNDPAMTVNARVLTLTEIVDISKVDDISSTSSVKILSVSLDVDSIASDGMSAKYSGKDWEYKDVTVTVTITKVGGKGTGTLTVTVNSGANKTAISVIDSKTFTAS